MHNDTFDAPQKSPPPLLALLLAKRPHSRRIICDDKDPLKNSIKQGGSGSLAKSKSGLDCPPPCNARHGANRRFTWRSWFPPVAQTPNAVIPAPSQPLVPTRPLRTAPATPEADEGVPQRQPSRQRSAGTLLARCPRVAMNRSPLENSDSRRTSRTFGAASRIQSPGASPDSRFGRLASPAAIRAPDSCGQRHRGRSGVDRTCPTDRHQIAPLRQRASHRPGDALTLPLHIPELVEPVKRLG